MTSKQMREDPNFVRDRFPCVGEFQFDIIRKQPLPDGDIGLVACSRTSRHDKPENYRKGVHFFVDDYRFRKLRNNVEAGLETYSKYRFLLSPDFSRYREMREWQMIEAIGMNRWCGAWWQSKGLHVIPSVGWGSQWSLRYCFLGVERNAPVAVTTNGNRRDKPGYLYGYDAMLERLDPSAILCLGKPFPEMRGPIVYVPYDYFGREVGDGRQ